MNLNDFVYMELIEEIWSQVYFRLSEKIFIKASSFSIKLKNLAQAKSSFSVELV